MKLPRCLRMELAFCLDSGGCALPPGSLSSVPQHSLGTLNRGSMSTVNSVSVCSQLSSDSRAQADFDTWIVSSKPIFHYWPVVIEGSDVLCFLGTGTNMVEVFRQDGTVNWGQLLVQSLDMRPVTTKWSE